MLTNMQFNTDYVNCYVMDIQKTITNSSERKSLVSPTKQYDYKGSCYNGSASTSIARRNARERNRVKQVNDGFNALRKRLPTSIITALSGNARRGSGKKLSKVDTLRMVLEYIKYLQSLVEVSDEALEITSMSRVTNATGHEVCEVFERKSTYSESALSPTTSEYSSGVSSIYSQNHYIPEEQFDEIQHIEENDILNAICW